MRLQAIGVRALEIRGLETEPVLDLRIERDGDLVRVWGATEEMSVDISADWLAVNNDSVSAYLKDPSWGW